MIIYSIDNFLAVIRCIRNCILVGLSSLDVFK